MQTSPRLRILLALLAAAAISTGCGGGGAKVEAKTTNTSTTMGQELMDIDAAYKQGIITQDQYDRSKKEILDRYNK
jgi:hypothetical protein